MGCYFNFLCEGKIRELGRGARDSFLNGGGNLGYIKELGLDFGLAEVDEIEH